MNFGTLLYHRSQVPLFATRGLPEKIQAMHEFLIRELVICKVDRQYVDLGIRLGKGIVRTLVVSKTHAFFEQ